MIELKRKWSTPVLLIATALLLTVIMTATRPDNVKIKVAERSLVVDVAEVAQQTLRIPIQAQGTVSPHRETDIVAEVVGKVISVSPSFYKGGYLAKGDVLLQIDDVEHQASLSRAQAAVASAQSNLAQEQGRAEVAKQEFSKIQSKHRSAASRDLYLRQPQLKQAQAQLLSAQADLRKAQHNLERTVVRAPYDSLIKEKQSDLGSYLSPGSPIVSLFATDFAEVRLAIPQSKLAYLELPKANQSDEQAATSVDLYTGVSTQQHWAAKLHRTEGVYDERSRVLFVVARINDPYSLQETPALETEQTETAAQTKTTPATTDKHQGQTAPLRMGAFVTAVVSGRQLEDLVVLPRRVLRTGDYVWVVDQQNTLRNRKVSTLRTQGDEIYVTAGLQNGDLVCLTPVGKVVEGSNVTIGSNKLTTQLYANEPNAPIQLAEPSANDATHTTVNEESASEESTIKEASTEEAATRAASTGVAS